MKTLLFILASTLAFGQTASVNGSTVRYRFTGGSSAPSGGSCDASTELNSVYVRYGAPATYPTQMYLCKQTGTSTYAWEPIGYRSGTTAPAKCTVGDVFFDTDASAGQNLYGCTAADMWTLQTGGSGSGIGYTGTFTGTTATITAATHNQGIHPIIFLYDASGSAVTAPYHCLTSGSAAVACAASTSVGDIVIETVASATYTYTVIGGTATAPYSTTVSAVTSQSISAATHGQGALAVAWCFDNSTPRLVVSCSYTRNTSGDLVFSFSPAFTGQIQIGNGNSGAGGGGSTTCFIDLDVNAMRNGGGGADVAGGGWAIQSTGATIFPELFGSTPPTGAITIKNGAASTDYVFKKIPWPRTCTGETGFTANLTFWIPTGGNVKTGLSLVCVAQGTNGENPTFPSQTYSTINATGSTTKSEVATFTFDLSACSAGNSLFFRLNRDNSVGSNAGDWARYTSGELYK